MNSGLPPAERTFVEDLVALLSENFASHLVDVNGTYIATFFTLTIIGLSLLYGLAIANLTAFKEDPDDIELRRIVRSLRKGLTRAAFALSLAYFCMLVASLHWPYLRVSQFLMNVAFVLHSGSVVFLFGIYSAFHRRIAVQLPIEQA